MVDVKEESAMPLAEIVYWKADMSEDSVCAVYAARERIRWRYRWRKVNVKEESAMPLTNKVHWRSR